LQFNPLDDNVAQRPDEAHATLPRRRMMPSPRDIAGRNGVPRSLMIAFTVHGAHYATRSNPRDP
jgi:hypothetical protein